VPPAVSKATPQRAVVAPIAAARFKVQFTASAALRDKLERLQALMRQSAPDVDLADVIEAAVSEKLERLEARRFAKTSRPRKSLADARTVPSSRHIPAPIRRAVHERDGGRCRFVDAQGGIAGAVGGAAEADVADEVDELAEELILVDCLLRAIGAVPRCGSSGPSIRSILPRLGPNPAGVPPRGHYNGAVSIEPSPQPRRRTPLRPRPEPRGRRRIEVPAAVLAGLVAALIGSLLLVAYLAGREAGRSASTSPPAPGPSPALPAASPLPREESPVPPPPAAPAFGAELGPPEPAAPPDAGERDAVALYFRTMESFEEQAEYWEDPQQLASSLVGQMTSGDGSGFDRLVEAQRQAEQSVASMVVPVPCREHHERTLALLRQALGLLTTVRTSITAGDLQAVMSVATRARSLESEARELERLAEALKERYRVAE
jgi:hypothetical protein